KAPGLARPPHALGVRVAAQRVVALREEQDVVAHRREPPSAKRARVGRRLQVLRAPELPPARLAAHVVVTVVTVPIVFVVVDVPPDENAFCCARSIRPIASNVNWPRSFVETPFEPLPLKSWGRMKSATKTSSRIGSMRRMSMDVQP